MYDVVIIGGGPAGLTAAIYAARFNLKTIIIGGLPGGLITETPKICNWPGEPAISGADLATRMVAHVNSLEVPMIYSLASEITKTEKGFLIKTADGSDYESLSVIYTLGTQHRHLGLPAEERLKGRGVTYCATCDAIFYRGKVTAVAGGGNSAFTAAIYLAEICPKVYLINAKDKPKAEKVLLDEAKRHENIVLLNGTNITDMEGEEKLKALKLDRPFEGSDRLEVDGLFVEVGLIPNTELAAKAGAMLDKKGYVQVAPDMSAGMPGFFAAGDVTSGSAGFRQIITAAAEGAIAANSAYMWVMKAHNPST